MNNSEQNIQYEILIKLSRKDLHDGIIKQVSNFRPITNQLNTIQNGKSKIA